MKAENIFLLEKGDVVQYDGEKMFSTEKVEAGNVLIDGSGVGDVGNIVLRDRRLLSEDGIFIRLCFFVKHFLEVLLDRLAIRAIHREETLPQKCI